MPRKAPEEIIVLIAGGLALHLLRYTEVFSLFIGSQL